MTRVPESGLELVAAIGEAEGPRDESAPVAMAPAAAALRDQARRLLSGPVPRRALALRFDDSRAATVETLVEGRAFYPRMLEDIASASSSIHIIQFGFRPGAVGDEFAEALLERAAAGVSVRLVVDGQGSDPERGTRTFYERLTSAGIEVCVMRATRLRVVGGPLGGGGATHWNLPGLGHIDHRKLVVIDGRIGWVGGAGIEDHFQDGRFHDLFLRVTGSVVGQLQLVFLAGFGWLGGAVSPAGVDDLFPADDDGDGAVPAMVLHNAPGRYRPITQAIAHLLENAQSTLDVVNPYVTDRAMIRRIEDAARRGVRVRLFVPGNANNWACAAAQQFHHASLLDAGVRILEYPAMLHAKAFVRDGEELLAGTCNLEAWSLKRFFEIDLRVLSTGVAAEFDERFSVPAEAVSATGRRLTRPKERAKAMVFAALSPLL
jgi:cardiolipin synthase